MHGHYRGLRRSPGSDWLNSVLIGLDRRGLGRLVQSFLAQMTQRHAVAGLLLEIKLAHQLTKYEPWAAVYSDRQDGVAEVPGDISYEYGGIRADFQCKAVINSFNEMWISDFLTWAEGRFARRSPGLLMEFSSALSLTEQDFKDFKQWFGSNQAGFSAHQVVAWTPINGGPGITLRFKERDEPGFARGVTWTSGPEPMSVIFVDADQLKNTAWKRIQIARRSFGFVPGPEQFNFVLIDISASGLYDEEDFYQALYGTHGWSISRETMQSKYQGHDSSGVFLAKNPSWISGVVFVQHSDRDSEYLVYPHPDHVQSVKGVWTRSPFRLGKAFVD